MSRGNDLPEFCKIYVSALCSNSMRIPPVFIKKFGESIPKTVTLRMPSGLSFQVHMHRIHEHWFFQKGWPEFVLENSLEDGDFITFCYVRDSEFLAKVFAINGCRKIINKTSMIDEKPVENMLVKEEPEPENNGQYRTTRRNVDPKCLSFRGSGQCRNPSFTVFLTKYLLARGYVHIPAAFWRVHLTRLEIGSVMATLWMRDKTWKAKLTVTANRMRFVAGCKKFIRDNSLKTRDSCTFQLMNVVDLSFKVTISR